METLDRRLVCQDSSSDCLSSRQTIGRDTRERKTAAKQRHSNIRICFTIRKAQAGADWQRNNVQTRIYLWPVRRLRVIRVFSVAATGEFYQLGVITEIKRPFWSHKLGRKTEQTNLISEGFFINKFYQIFVLKTWSYWTFIIKSERFNPYLSLLYNKRAKSKFLKDY